MESSSNFQTGALLDVVDDGRVMLASETFSPTGPVAKVFGVIGGLAFIGVGLFFLIVEIDGPRILLYILTSGLFLIGLAVIWSSTSKVKEVRYLSLDRARREIRYGMMTSDGTRSEEGLIAISDLDKVETSRAMDANDATGIFYLYVAGRGSPSNGLLLQGTMTEIDGVVRQIRSSKG